MLADPAEYRKMAELCRQYAQDLNDGRYKARWLRIAEGWMVLARDGARAANVTAAARAVVPIVLEQHA
jgi:hypothetical protein